MGLLYGRTRVEVGAYIGQVTIDLKLEEVKSVMFEEASSKESSCSWEKAIRVNLPPYQWNMKAMAFSPLSFSGMVTLSYKCLNWGNEEM